MMARSNYSWDMCWKIKLYSSMLTSKSKPWSTTGNLSSEREWLASSDLSTSSGKAKQTTKCLCSSYNVQRALALRWNFSGEFRTHNNETDVQKGQRYTVPGKCNVTLGGLSSARIAVTRRIRKSDVSYENGKDMQTKIRTKGRSHLPGDCSSDLFGLRGLGCRLKLRTTDREGHRCTSQCFGATHPHWSPNREQQVRRDLWRSFQITCVGSCGAYGGALAFHIQLMYSPFHGKLKAVRETKKWSRSGLPELR